MIFVPSPMLIVNPSEIVVDTADFDGANDYMTRGAGLTGAADSKSGILSVWARLDGADGSAVRLLWGNTVATIFVLSKTASNIFELSADNAAGAAVLGIQSDTAYTAGATWLHILAAWNLAAGVGQLYINDADDIAAAPLLTNDTIDYTLADWAIGADVSGNNKFNGCLAEVYFAPGQYLDISSQYIRRKFISSTGKPVSLGTDGSKPTGTAPIVYQHLDDAEAVANFATNRGTGGNFSITGTLETGSSSPSG